MSRRLVLQQWVTLPVGLRVGMGQLRIAVRAQVTREERANDGGFFYGFDWVDRKTGRMRSTWARADEVQP